MRNFARNTVAAAVIAFASQTAAQVASICPTTDVCFKLNIPDSTASSGNGDIFFQVSAPSSYEYIALGQGTSMSGSQIFVVYTSGNGNVTVSPRLGTGHQMPNYNSDAKVTLLEGSGVSNGKMVANVKCESCNSWSGGTASFSDDKGNWIYAYRSSGGPKNSNDQSATIQQHSNEDAFSWSYANAKGGSSVNPLVSSNPTATGTGSGGVTSCVPRPASTGGSASGSASGSAAATATVSDDDDTSTSQRGRSTSFPTGRPNGPPKEKRADVNYCDDNGSSSGSGFTSLGSQGNFDKQKKMLVAHGVLAALAFVIFFPIGAIAIRLASFTGVVWMHAAFQVFAYLIFIIAFGIGVYLANEFDLLDQKHPIIGIVVFVCLFFQPIFGFLHHALYKKYQSRTFWSYGHIWLGRAVITLGIVNGGLGMQLANKMNLSSKSGMIAYGVIAGVIWLLWVVAVVIGERRRSKAATNGTPKYSLDSVRPEATERSDVPHPEHGHYAPR